MSRRSIRILRADGMDRTFFEPDDPPEELSRIGVSYEKDEASADIVISRWPHLLRKHGKAHTRFAIWTHEPRWSLEQNRLSIVSGVDRPVHVMNAYTGMIYCDNYHSNYAHRKAVDYDERMCAFGAKPDRVAMLATYMASEPLVIAGSDIDLYRRRQELGLELQRRGVCDIYGNGWPADVPVAGRSRDGAWWATKREILSRYSVNIAFESTYIAGYVTEKIWDAVAGATLPVYYGADNGVYRDFPRGSFLDAAGKTTERVADEIMQMPGAEKTDRYEACLLAYLPVVKEDRYAASYKALARRTADFIEEVMSAEE